MKILYRAPFIFLPILVFGAACASSAGSDMAVVAEGPAAREAAPLPPPPDIRFVSTEPRGALIIVGGGAQPASVVKRFVDLAGGAGAARIAVIPLASGAPGESGGGKVEQLEEEYGAEAFVLNPTREEAMRTETAARLDGVTGVWFTGGDQSRITDALTGTRLLEAIHRARALGAVIGGTSAGAAIMSDSMLTGDQVRDDSLAYYGDEFPVIATHTIEVVPGLGFLPGTIVDQHFIQRERHNRLLSAVLERPTLIGVGIDESTAIEVADGKWTVLGESQVLIVDARDARVSATEAPLGAAGVSLHVLPPGATYNPATGAVELHRTPELQGSIPSSEDAS